MTTVKSPLPRSNPLSCLTPVRASTPLKSALSSLQPILPDIFPPTVIQKHRTKKHVRFALKLEPADETSPLSPDQENDFVLTTKPNKRVIDPWREDGPLYGAYVEYLERKDALTPEITEKNQPSPPSPEVEPPTYTHTFLIHSRSPEMVVDSIRVSTPSRHLPRILHTITPNKKTNRKSFSPVIDPYLKHRINVSTPPRPLQSKRVLKLVNTKNPVISRSPIAKRADLALPAIKNLNSNENAIQSDHHIGKKFVNEYFQSKKLTEIITNPLPGTNHQINHITGHSILPNLSKAAHISYQHQMNDKSCVFQNHNNDHFQSIIHSTH